MSTKKPSPQYTAEFRSRGVRLFREQRADYASDNAASWPLVPVGSP